jgi:hypothetical protein
MFQMVFLGPSATHPSGIATRFNKTVELPNGEPVKENGVVIPRIRRIDFIGATFLSTGSVSFLFAVDILAEHKSGQTVKLAIAISASVLLILSFFFMEAKHVKEPVFPPKLLLRRDVATTYSISLLQSAAQIAVGILYAHCTI